MKEFALKHPIITLFIVEDIMIGLTNIAIALSHSSVKGKDENCVKLVKTVGNQIKKMSRKTSDDAEEGTNSIEVIDGTKGAYIYE